MTLRSAIPFALIAMLPLALAVVASAAAPALAATEMPSQRAVIIGGRGVLEAMPVPKRRPPPRPVAAAPEVRPAPAEAAAPLAWRHLRQELSPLARDRSLRQLDSWAAKGRVSLDDYRALKLGLISGFPLPEGRGDGAGTRARR